MESSSASAPQQTRQSLRLLSYNIQVGITTRTYRQYFTGGWKHLLPYKGRSETLVAIAKQVEHYDLVALQESDSGSLRSGFINQTEQLAKLAHFPCWHERTNRRIGHLASHSLGAISRLQPHSVSQLALPGLVPGRGALLLKFGADGKKLAVMVVHLALGKRARQKQLLYIARILRRFEHAIIMGDFNTSLESSEMRLFFEMANLQQPELYFNTWPSWQPRKNFDHILVTPEIKVSKAEVLPSESDHLPISLEVQLPSDCTLYPPTINH
ncbi:MAG: endonuclease/exonuclease/phosphatase family protein [Gammaproteobacteria bacterium]|nr:endonuclease/exonuclease/phosphatase family protein [Gammaproteobacteria bacterium]